VVEVVAVTVMMMGQGKADGRRREEPGTKEAVESNWLSK
jgi:hypothetical protein